MRLLLDTGTFLNAVLFKEKVSKRAIELMMDPESELHFSVISSWEIAIKYSLGKLTLPQNPEDFVPVHRAALGAELLHLDEESAFHVRRLPNIHHDPFDRLLISQAIVQGMILLTSDEKISRYPVRTAW